MGPTSCCSPGDPAASDIKPDHDCITCSVMLITTAQRDLLLHSAPDALSTPACAHSHPAFPCDPHTPNTHTQARFAQWAPVLQLTPAELDYSNDGIMVSPAADAFGRGVYHYVRALAYAAAAAHKTGARGWVWRGCWVGVALGSGGGGHTWACCSHLTTVSTQGALHAHTHTVLAQAGSESPQRRLRERLVLQVCPGLCVYHRPIHTHPPPYTGDARQQAESSLAVELQALSAAVEATPADVVTRPGEGLGVPAPGFKALGRMELLVS